MIRELLNNLPYRLQTLVIGLPIHTTKNIQLDNLPLSLETLIIYNCVFSSPLDMLPDGVKTIEIYDDCGAFTQPFMHLPSQLHTLKLSLTYPHKYIEDIKNRYPNVFIMNI